MKDTDFLVANPKKFEILASEVADFKECFSRFNSASASN